MSGNDGWEPVASNDGWEPADTKKSTLEFPDAPTFAALEHAHGLKTYKSPLDALANIGEASKDLWAKGGDILASSLGPLMTDNPRARQEIVAKHLTGAEAVDDKYGNPMIRHNGKLYYAARPGEIDAMDIGRAGLGTAMGMPIAAAAVPLAGALGGGVAAYGITNAIAGGAQSVAEDALAKGAGGKSQEIDLKKAGINAAISAAIPVTLQKAVMPAAGYLAERLANLTGRGLLVDAAGQVTAKGARIFHEAGIDPSIMTPQQLRVIQAATLRNFSSTDAARTAGRMALGDEFQVPQTTGQVTGNLDQIGFEDAARNGGKGGAAQSVVRAAGADQEVQLTAAQQALRGRLSGAPPMTPPQIGETVGQRFGRANNEAADEVTHAYNSAVEPTVLAANGVPDQVPLSHVAGIPGRLRQGLQDGTWTRGQPVVVDPQLTPAATRALQVVDNFGQGRVADLASAPLPPGSVPVAVNWQGVDQTRKLLVAIRGAAAPGSTDARAVGSIMRGFDADLGALNPMLNDARALHADRAATFRPAPTNAPGTNSVLKTLNDANAPQQNVADFGQTIYNRLFDGAPFKRGEGTQLVGRLQTIFANQPEGMQAVREGALNRLFYNQQGVHYSPHVTHQNITNALNGPQAEVYRALFTAEQRAHLERFSHLSGNIAEGLARGNPSGSGHTILNAVKGVGAGGTVGGAIGGAIGTAFGMPVPGAAAGSAVGGFIGNKIAGAHNLTLAQRAILGQPLQRPIPYGLTVPASAIEKRQE